MTLMILSAHPTPRASLEAPPSLGVDLPTLASRCPVRPLIALGTCDLLTVRALTTALREGAA
ncbi:hypothetical protein [Streptomyces sp. NPDC000931]|uniref:hypothetical protein n=1 Tax=Streptomyces sp. NPDC000931 TaxID=3154372 RepID=UPI003329A572